MPAYSTWQPIEGKIQPVASADQSATRRLVDPRGDLLRGKPIVSTLLGVFGGPSDRFLEGGYTAVGSPFLVPPAPSPPTFVRHLSSLASEIKANNSHCLIPVAHNAHFGPCGAVVGLITPLRNRLDRPVWHNDSARFQEKPANECVENLASAESPGYLL
jgi:hypothetical protein